MKQANKVAFVVILALLASCRGQEWQVVELPFAKDLIPEGIAIDGRTKKLYLNSLKKSMVVTSSLDGTHASVFLDSYAHGYLPGFGMTIKGDTLYALGNSLETHNNKSTLLLMQISTKKLIDSYNVERPERHYLNDLAVSTKDRIFITDSESNKVYHIHRPSKKIEVFMDSPAIANSNGIAISKNGEYLYLATSNGIQIIEIKSQTLTNTPEKSTAGIDGLKYYKNRLYAIVNGWGDPSKNGLFEYTLSTNGKEIRNRRKLVDFTKDFQIPTTFDILDGSIYFVMNTQLDNFDENKKEIVEIAKLEKYRLLKVEIE